MRSLDLWKPIREDENNTKYYDKNGNVQVIVKRNINVKGKPTCMMWFGKAQNPRYNYYFENEEKCTRFINENVTNYIADVNKKLDKKQLVKELRKNYQPKVNIGDIFHSSYGYSMILNSWFQILSIKGKTVEMQKIQMERRRFDAGKHLTGRSGAERGAGRVRGRGASAVFSVITFRTTLTPTPVLFD